MFAHWASVHAHARAPSPPPGGVVGARRRAVCDAAPCERIRACCVPAQKRGLFCRELCSRSLFIGLYVMAAGVHAPARPFFSDFPHKSLFAPLILLGSPPHTSPDPLTRCFRAKLCFGDPNIWRLSDPPSSHHTGSPRHRPVPFFIYIIIFPFFFTHPDGFLSRPRTTNLGREDGGGHHLHHRMRCVGRRRLCASWAWCASSSAGCPSLPVPTPFPSLPAPSQHLPPPL